MAIVHIGHTWLVVQSPVACVQADSCATGGISVPLIGSGRTFDLDLQASKTGSRLVLRQAVGDAGDVFEQELRPFGARSDELLAAVGKLVLSNRRSAVSVHCTLHCTVQNPTSTAHPGTALTIPAASSLTPAYNSTGGCDSHIKASCLIPDSLTGASLTLPSVPSNHGAPPAVLPAGQLCLVRLQINAAISASRYSSGSGQGDGGVVLWEASPAAVLLVNAMQDAARQAAGHPRDNSQTGFVSDAQDAELPWLLGQSQAHKSGQLSWVQELVRQELPVQAKDLQRHFSLVSCFSELPSCKLAPALPPILRGSKHSHTSNVMLVASKAISGCETMAPLADRAAHAAVGKRTETAAAAAAPAMASRMQVEDIHMHNMEPSSSLHDLPDPLIMMVLSHLSPKDLRSAACTCRALHEAAQEQAPGLKLELFSHQRTAILWMQRREKRAGPVPHAYNRRWCSKEGLPLLVDLSNGKLLLSPDMEGSSAAALLVDDVHGGFFCDEPGLGKTITALGLILKSRGTIPLPPPEACVTWATDASGKRAGFYTLQPPIRRGGSVSTSINGVDGGSPQVTPGSKRGGSESNGLGLVTPGPAMGNGHGSAEVPRSGRGKRPAPQQSPLSPSSQDANGIQLPAARRRRQQQPLDMPDSLTQVAATAAAVAAAAAPGAVADCGVGGGFKLVNGYSPNTTSTWGGCLLANGVHGSSLHAAQPAVGLMSGTAPVLNGGVISGVSCPAHGLDLVNGSLHAADRSKRIAQLPHAEAAASKGGASGSSSAHGSAANQAGPSRKEAVQVQCDACGKWRMMPPGTQIDEAGSWFCHMHPISGGAGCGLPEAAVLLDEYATFDACPGYVAAGIAYHQPSNIAYFTTLLDKHPNLLEASALRWLSHLEPSQLKRGVRIPRDAQDPPGYESFFRALDIVNDVRLAATSIKGGGRSGKKAKRKGSDYEDEEEYKAVKATPPRASAHQHKHTWRQAHTLHKLFLDIPALRAALDQARSNNSALASVNRMYLSPATLVVVPGVLVEHWREQIEMHTEPGALRVYIHEGSTSGMPPTAMELAWDYDLVITTFERLSTDWQPKHEVEIGHKPRPPSPLLKVHWLRVVLDEGHMLGASLAMTNKLQMACRLSAERRWIMTGTPTPSTASSDIAHLQPLLAFLRHTPYGTSSGAWVAAVQRPFEKCKPEGRARLMELLRNTMIRACKSDLATLPPLHVSTTLLDFCSEHAGSYNELVEVVERNLLLADWRDEDHNESLLAAKNAVRSRETLKNVRLACCVAGNIELQAKEEDILEVLEILVDRLHLPKVPNHPLTNKPEGPPWLPKDHPLVDVEVALRDGCACQVCGMFSKQPIVTPCAHMTCLGCTAPHRTHCPVASCGKAYTMQGVDDPKRLEHNPKPKWEVPLELIEDQPVYHQRGATGLSGGSWNAKWQVTRSTRVLHLLHRLYEIGAASRPPRRSRQQQLQHVQRQWDADHWTTALGKGAGLSSQAGQNVLDAARGGSSLQEAGVTGAAAMSAGGATGPLLRPEATAAGGAGEEQQRQLQQQQLANCTIEEPTMQAEPVEPTMQAGLLPLLQQEQQQPEHKPQRRRARFADDDDQPPAPHAPLPNAPQQMVLHDQPSAGVPFHSADILPDRADMLAAIVTDTAAAQAVDGHMCADMHVAPLAKRARFADNAQALRSISATEAASAPPSGAAADSNSVGDGSSCCIQEGSCAAGLGNPTAVLHASHAALHTNSFALPLHPPQNGDDIIAHDTAKPLGNSSSLGVSTAANIGASSSTSTSGILRSRRTVGPEPSWNVPETSAGPSNRSPHGAYANGADAPGAAAVKVKAIVYSGFWQHLSLIDSYLSQARVRFEAIKGGQTPQERKDALASFRNNPSIGVLLMDDKGAVGLDLSFVSYVFLMEPLADRSLEQQVISRAHRMGVKRAVIVERLVMRNTAEEDVEALTTASAANRLQSADAAAAVTNRDAQLPQMRAAPQFPGPSGYPSLQLEQMPLQTPLQAAAAAVHCGSAAAMSATAPVGAMQDAQASQPQLGSLAAAVLLAGNGASANDGSGAATGAVVEGKESDTAAAAAQSQTPAEAPSVAAAGFSHAPVTGKEKKRAKSSGSTMEETRVINNRVFLNLRRVAVNMLRRYDELLGAEDEQYMERMQD